MIQRNEQLSMEEFKMKIWVNLILLCPETGRIVCVFMPPREGAERNPTQENHIPLQK